MAQEKAKYSIRVGLLQGGIFANDVDIWENNVFKIVVENAGATNTIEILGRINGEENYHLIDTVVGNNIKVVNIQYYDFIRLNVTVYDSPSNYLKVTGSAFTTPSSNGSVTVDTSDLVLNSKTPTVQIIQLVSNATQYSMVLPNGTKRFTLKDRNYSSSIKIAYTSGGDYLTLPRGCSYSEEQLSLTGKTVYIQSDKNNTTIECLIWT